MESISNLLVKRRVTRVVQWVRHEPERVNEVVRLPQDDQFSDDLWFAVCVEAITGFYCREAKESDRSAALDVRPGCLTEFPIQLGSGAGRTQHIVFVPDLNCAASPHRDLISCCWVACRNDEPMIRARRSRGVGNNRRREIHVVPFIAVRVPTPPDRLSRRQSPILPRRFGGARPEERRQ